MLLHLFVEPTHAGIMDCWSPHLIHQPTGAYWYPNLRRKSFQPGRNFMLVRMYTREKYIRKDISISLLSHGCLFRQVFSQTASTRSPKQYSCVMGRIPR